MFTATLLPAATMRTPIKDLLSNATATGARLLAGMVLFVVMGRVLGPAAFGNFMAAMATAALLAFGANLGFAQQSLREIAAHPGQAARIVGNLASAKLTLALLVLAAIWCVALALGSFWWLVAVLTTALVFDGAVEFLFAMLKGHGRFGLEAGFSTVASVLHFVVVGAVCLQQADPLIIAVAFLVSRLLQFVAAVWLCGRQVALPRLGQPLAGQWAELRAGWAYALDNGLTQLAAQADTVLVRLLLGAHAAGIYQAGMRVVVGLQTLTMVAGNVFIPRLAKSAGQVDEHRRVLRQVRRVYIGLALVSGLLAWGLGWALQRYGYGAAFAELQALWPWFALLVALRAAAARYGVQLTAMGRQAMRSVVNMGSLALMVAVLLATTAAGHGLQGVALALLTGAAFVLVVYRRQVRQQGSTA